MVISGFIIKSAIDMMKDTLNEILGIRADKEITGNIKRLLTEEPHDWAIQFHGFYVDTAAREMRFDVVMSFDIPAAEGLDILYAEMKQAYPGYKIQIIPDVDISD